MAERIRWQGGATSARPTPTDRTPERIAALPDHPASTSSCDATGSDALRRQGEVAAQAGPELSRRGPRAPPARHGRGGGRSVEFVATATEAGGLLLENNWIKRHRPRYNVLLRDDKTYPYLKLTREPWPRLVFTRRIRRRRCRLLRSLPAGRLGAAGDRSWSRSSSAFASARIEIDGGLPRPCLYHDMKRCLGPCVAGLTSAADYGEAVEGARLFLGGKIEPLCPRLRPEMRGGGGDARIRARRPAARPDAEIETQGDAVATLLGRTRRTSISSVLRCTVDQAAVSILVMRGGQVLDRRELFWEGEQSPARRSRSSPSCCPRSTTGRPFCPRRFTCRSTVDGDEALADMARRSARGSASTCAIPVRGPKAERLRIAAQDAEFAFRPTIPSGDPARDESPRALADTSISRSRRDGSKASTSRTARASRPSPRWSSGATAASARASYRSFNIRGFDGQDDFRSIERGRRTTLSPAARRVGSAPDLVLIDGGRGQLNAALAALAGSGSRRSPVVALAKREEELYLPGAPEPLRLPRSDAGLRLLQMLRDETHRFALVSAPAAPRPPKPALRSRLDEIPGVGPVRRKRLLLERYGTWRADERGAGRGDPAKCWEQRSAGRGASAAACRPAAASLRDRSRLRLRCTGQPPSRGGPVGAQSILEVLQDLHARAGHRRARGRRRRAQRRLFLRAGSLYLAGRASAGPALGAGARAVSADRSNFAAAAAARHALSATWSSGWRG